MAPLFLLYVDKLLLTGIIAYLAKLVVPYRGFFPYSEQLLTFAVPDYIYSLANFDGIHYIQIASVGYSQYQEAFFPLYPLLIRFFSNNFFHNPLVAGLLISNISFIVGLVFFYKLLRLLKHSWPMWTIVFLLAFPTSFFFHAVYTESLFFMLVTVSLYFLKTKKFVIAGLLAAAASATRLTGVFLFIPFVFLAYKKGRGFNLLYSFLPPLGLAAYMIYLYVTTGSPFSFFSSLAAFGPQRSTHLILLPQVYFRYLKIFFFSDLSVAYFIAFIECFIFTSFFVICTREVFRSYKKREWFYFSLALFSLAILLLPTFTGSFSSIPRYALLAPTPFLYLGALKNTVIKVLLLSVCTLLQTIVFALFVQGYFVG